MNRKDRQREQTLRHGLALILIFNLPESTMPVTLCKAVHRLEGEAHRLAERQCCEGLDEAYVEKKEASILRRLDALLKFQSQGIPVFLNGDPRGYAIKIDEEYVRKHGLEIHRDWGGYGIIAPELDGS